MYGDKQYLSTSGFLEGLDGTWLSSGNTMHTGWVNLPRMHMDFRYIDRGIIMTKLLLLQTLE